jgi:hypothetical protein
VIDINQGGEMTRTYRAGRRGHTRSPYTRTVILDVIQGGGRRQSWVAEQMGITDQHLSRVGRGHLPISNEFVTAACRVLQLPPSALFFADPLRDVMHDGTLARTEAVA